MSKITQPELVINATLVTKGHQAIFYEFVLNEALTVVDCGKVESLSHGLVNCIDNYTVALQGLLFELNHVRVNPTLDNTQILNDFTLALENAGVAIYNPPTGDMMAVCFRPLGELSEIVRFYITPACGLVLLCPIVKLRRIK